MAALALSPPSPAWANPAPDADLIAIGRQLDRLIPACNEAYARANHLFDKHQLNQRRRPDEAESAWIARLTAVEHACGFAAVTQRGDALATEIGRLADRARSIPATTIAGLIVKARLAIDEMGPRGRTDEMLEVTNNLLDNLLALHAA